jgi:serine protein kinase
MQTLDWIVSKENDLKKQINNINAELETIRVVKDYLKLHFFNNAAQELFLKYIKHVDAYCNWSKVVSDGRSFNPDECFMRDIEDKIGISENAKKSFREEILIRGSSLSRKGQVFDYNSHERLKIAIEKSL